MSAEESRGWDSDESDDVAKVDETTAPMTLTERSLEAVAKFILNDEDYGFAGLPRIVIVAGAGISTAAGIPDFRTPGTGLYDNLASLNLSQPHDVFDLDFFRSNPVPFYQLAKDLYPGSYHPTISHVFIALLARKGLLTMLFTQNIDCLSAKAGVPPELTVEAHGSMATQRCTECDAPYPDDLMRQHVAASAVPYCAATEGCRGVVKPDIVFFGEQLPERFFMVQEELLPEYWIPEPWDERLDLMFVMGTSLPVPPVATLPELCPDAAPRVLINREVVGDFGTRADDVVVLGDCDATMRRLADLLGWREELEAEWRRLVGDEEAEKQLARSARAAAAAAAAAALRAAQQQESDDDDEEEEVDEEAEDGDGDDDVDADAEGDEVGSNNQLLDQHHHHQIYPHRQLPPLQSMANENTGFIHPGSLVLQEHYTGANMSPAFWWSGDLAH